MDYVFLLLAMTSSAALSVMSTLFGRQNSGAQNTSGIYTLVLSATTFIAWGASSLAEGAFELGVLKYSLLYGVLYTVAMVGMFRAYQTGSVSLTAFVKQLSLIGVAFWGLAFWGNPLNATVVAGLVLIIVALYLCFKRDGRTDVARVNARWLLFSLMLLIGNAGCSIVQKYQQLEFDGRFKSLFMFFAAGIAFAVSAALCFGKKNAGIKDINAKTLLYPILGGISSALLNFLIMTLIASSLSESVIFPGIAVGGLALTSAFSMIFYKERISRLQWCGLSLGVVALVLLNL